METRTRLAVLIDADNAPPALAGALLAEIAKYGTATVKRAYGDWTTQNLGGWKKTLAEHAIQPIQQFRNTVGKNASDSALIIDAMDLLYSGRLDGFCIVSSDSDFTRLASRVRETGAVVYGFGERKTPRPFVSACDKFVYVDNLGVAVESAPAAAASPVAEAMSEAAQSPAASEGQQNKAGAPLEKIGRKLFALLTAAVEASADDEGWAHLGQVGQYISKQKPDFDPRSYGEKRLSDLVKAVGHFVIEARVGADGKASAFYVRRK